MTILSSSATMHIAVLKAEVEILKIKLQPEDTGHIHTTINTLEWRIKQIEEKGII